MKKLLSLLLVGVMSVMLLAGCGTTGGGQDNPASGSDETEKSISIAQSANFSMGFAPGVQSYETTYYTNNFYESLVEYRDGEYQPCLATDWTVSEDGLTYTFYLREDVQFNDGTAFNAEAVKLYWFPYDPYTFVANMYPSTDYSDPSGIYSTDPQVAKALASMSDEEAQALIAGLYNTDDPAVVQEIFTEALNSANESSVIIPLNYRNEYAVFNSDVIESYTFNSIPNHVDVAAIHLK